MTGIDAKKDEPKHTNHEMWDHRKKMELKRADKKERRKERKAEKNVKIEAQAKPLSGYSPLTSALDSLIGQNTTAYLSFLINTIRLVRELASDIPRHTKATLVTFWIQNLGLGVLESNIVGVIVGQILDTAPSVKQIKSADMSDVSVVTSAQAFSDELDKVGDVLEYTFNSSFATAVQTLIVYGTLTNLMPHAVKYDVYRWLGRPDPKATLLYVVESSIKASARIIKMCEMIAKGEPLCDALFARDPAVFNRVKAAELLLQKDHLYTGLKQVGKYNRYTWLNEAKGCIEYFKRRLALTSSSRPEYIDLSRHYAQLSDAYSTISATVNGGWRPMPFAMILGKDPGIGKSRLIDIFLAQMAILMELEYSGDMVYHVDPKSDFWEGYKNQMFLHYPELGTESVKIAEMKGNQATEGLTRVCDSQPTLVPMAFDDKGKIWLQALAVIVDTNTFDLNIPHMVNNPAAFLRRFLHIQADVLPEYRKQVGDQLTTAIDYTKCMAALKNKTLDHPANIYKISAWYQVPLDQKRSTRQSLCDGVSLKKFLILLRGEMAAHMEGQEYIRQNLDNFVDVLGDAHGPNFRNDNKPEEPDKNAPIEGLLTGLASIKNRVAAYSNSAHKSFVDHILKNENIVKPVFEAMNATDFYKSLVTRREILTSDSVNPEAMRIEDAQWKELQDMSETKEDLESIKSDESTIEFEAVVEEMNAVHQIIKDNIDWTDYTEPPKPVQNIPLVSDLFEIEEKEVKTDAQSYTLAKLSMPRRQSDRVEITSLSTGMTDALNIIGSTPEIIEAIYDRLVLTGVVYRLVGGQEIILFNRDNLEYDPIRILQVAKHFCTMPVSFTENYAVRSIRSWSYNLGISSSGRENEVLPQSRLPKVEFEKSMTDCIKHDVKYGATIGSAWFQNVFQWARDINPAFGNVVVTFLSILITLCLMPFFGVFAIPMYVFVYGFTLFFLERQVNFIKGYIVTKFPALFMLDYQTLKRAGQATAVLTAILGVYSATSLFKKKGTKTDAQAISSKDELNDLVSAGDGFVSKKCKSVHDQWERQVSVDHSGSNTSNLNDASVCFKRNSRLAIVSFYDGNTRRSLQGYLYGIDADLVVMPSHYFADGDKWDLQVSQVSGGKPSAKMDSYLIERPYLHFVKDSDLVFFRLLGGRFSNKYRFLPEENTHDPNGRGMFKNEGVAWDSRLENAENVAPTGKSFNIKKPIRYWTKTSVGDCGLPFTTQGIRGCYIGGIHVGGGSCETATGVKYFGISSCVTKAMVRQAKKAIDTAMPFAQALSLPDEEVLSGKEDIKLSELKEPNVHSPFVHEPFHNISYFGHTGKKVHANQKSSLTKSIFAHDAKSEEKLIEVFMYCFNTPPKKLYSKPMMAPKHVDGKFVSPYNINLRKMNKAPVRLSPTLMLKVVQVLSDQLIANLSAKGYTRDWKPYTLDHAINGSPNDVYFKGINLSTSAGFGFEGTKREHTTVDEFGVVHLKPDVEQSLFRAVDRILKGEDPGFVHTQALKDEPRELEKCRCGKTRCFFMTNIVNLVLARMFLGPLYRSMVANCDCFYSAIGTNAHRDFDALHTHLSEFSPNIMEGDYGGYDTSMPIDVAVIANTVTLNVLRYFGYTDTALVLTSGVLNSCLFLTYELLGDIYRVVGKQPSGKYGTAEDNSIRNLVIMLLFWYSDPYLRILNFFQFVRVVAYGDDMIAAVKNEVKDRFNNVTFANFVNSIGMEFTSATKGEITQEFLDLSEASFLKRRFVIKPDLDKIVGTLDIDSIFKMIQWVEPSKVASEALQMTGTIDSCLRESFFHLDRDKYTYWLEYLSSTYKERFGSSENTDSRFHSYDSLIHEYGAEDVAIEAQALTCSFDETPKPVAVGQVFKSKVGDGMCKEFKHAIFKNGYSAESYEIYLARCESELKEAQYELESLSNPFPGVHPMHYSKLEEYHANSVNVARCEAYKKAYLHVVELEDTIKILSSVVNKKRWNAVCQAEMTEIKDEPPDDDKIQKWISLMRRTVIAAQAKTDLRMSDVKHIDITINTLYTAVLRETGRGSLYQLTAECQLMLWNDFKQEFKENNVVTEIQSDTIPVIDKGPIDSGAEEKIENLTDVGGMPTEDFSKGVSVDMTHDTAYMIQNFFTRPIELSLQSVPLNSRYFVSLNPWTAITSEPSFRAKYRNYSFMRANLKIKVSVSGSLNHYGRIMIGYVPLVAYNNIANFYDGAGSLYDFARLSYMSQLKHSIVLDVADNEPVEATFPFISFNPMARLYNQQTNANAGNLNDFANMGKIWVAVLNQVSCVNNVAATALSLQMYGWLEDVTMCQPTATVISIVTESKELKQGVVERVASAGADLAGSLTVVPGLQPFARASQITLKGIAELAALFGFSMPNMPISENKPNYVKNEPFLNAVNTISYNMGKKMTMDPLQEVILGSGVFGVTEDEMAIFAMARKWSLLDQFVWANADSPLNSINWKAAVTPLNAVLGPISAPNAFIQPTALAFAAQPFAYWHGTIEYRFEVVNSRFHRGKIMILFDPNMAQYSLITATIKLNKQNAIILDIQESNQVTVCVRWNRHRFWQPCNLNNQVGLQSVGTNFLRTLTSTGVDRYTNGFIVVTPFTKLQSPDNSSVGVNVYIRAGEDFAVNQLNITNNPRIRTTTQSNDVSTEEVSCVELNEKVLEARHKSGLHFGEQPVSFRSYLKRFYKTGTGSVIATTSSTYQWTGLYLPDNANPWGTAGGNVMDLMSYLRPAYIGYRGSVRKRLRAWGLHYAAGDHVKVYQNMPSTTVTATGFTDSATSGCDHNGTATFVPFTNAGVEVELPFYSISLFWPAGVDTSSTMSGLSDSQWESIQTYNYLSTFEISGNNTAQTLRVVEETAYGDDSSLIYFIAAAPYVTASY
uniref:Genome polyprotein n=1 Tax=Renmark bee virus 4 TaxID=2201310 RepID=A0A2U8JQ92_9VIRU|nr:polyprotein [Renmark bee virus 4]